jgi:hypothetical protein
VSTAAPRRREALHCLPTVLVKIFFHDACFDGTASTALFARFYRDVLDPRVAIQPVPVQHRDGDPFAGLPVDGDDNACVDFRYCPSPRMRWWFDHHRTAFQPPTLRALFEADRTGTKFFDPAAPSCAGLVARTLHDRYGWTPPPLLAEVVRWAEVIDAAGFASAEEATSLVQPAQQLALWLGNVREPALIERYIGLLDQAPLAELAEQPWVREVVQPLIEDRDRAVDSLRAAARRDGDVVTFDLLDDPAASSPGFLGYLLFPDCRYTVALTRAPTAIKIAVGSNPWAPKRRTHDLGELCERHGGGGHAAVGGVTLELHESARARAAAAAIVGELLVEPAEALPVPARSRHG